MKRIVSFLGVVMLTLTAAAQTLYPELPDSVWAGLIAENEANEVRLVANNTGQYLGQLDESRRMDGFGRYLDNKGNQRVGLFIDGAFGYGVTLTRACVTLGTERRYACFSADSGALDYVMVDRQRSLPESNTRVLDITRPNGDRYICELREGQMTGLGLIYYANGDMWFGQMQGGERCGYGCLFTVSNKLTVGCWRGDILFTAKKRRRR